MLQRSSNIIVKVYLYFVAHHIYRLGDLECLWEKLLMVFDQWLKVLVGAKMFLVMMKMYLKKVLVGHLQGWVRPGKMFGSSNAGDVEMKLGDFHEFVQS